MSVRAIPASLIGLVVLLELAGCRRSASTTQVGSDKTIGFVLADFDYQIYTTPDGKEECPQGFAYTNKDNWLAQFPTPAQRKAQFDRCGAMSRRGPDCESVLAAPELVKDPLPYREVQGLKSYGANLDGTDDGSETPTTCAHQKFVSLDGVKGVDNQYYRFVGCERVLHTDMHTAEARRREIKALRRWRTLLEVRGVKDPRNDARVQVVVYQGAGPLAVDSQDNAVPWQTQSIDQGVPPQYLRARIVAGELITEPADIAWAHVPVSGGTQSVLLRGAQWRLHLSEAGAEGSRTGYVDATQEWLSRKLGFQISQVSPPAQYAALHRLADGYKDPQTGACTALSSSAKFRFVRAYLRHPPAEQQVRGGRQ